MDGWPLTFWLIAVVLVVVVLVGAWMIVRVFRARRPTPGSGNGPDRER